MISNKTNKISKNELERNAIAGTIIGLLLVVTTRIGLLVFYKFFTTGRRLLVF